MAKQKTARKPRTSRPRQTFIPGTEPPVHKDIDKLADEFLSARNAWQAMKQPMIDKRDLLEVKMKEHGLKAYEYDGKVVEFAATEKVVVRVKKDAAESNGDGEE